MEIYVAKFVVVITVIIFCHISHLPRGLFTYCNYWRLTPNCRTCPCKRKLEPLTWGTNTRKLHAPDTPFVNVGHLGGGSIQVDAASTRIELQAIDMG